MTLSDLTGALDRANDGLRIYERIRELFPICRSITGSGVRQTLEIIRRDVPLTIHEVPTGTQVFDWTVPREWNIRGAYVLNPRGEKIIDFAACNLHVVGYSVPVRARMSLAELKPHLFTLPDRPAAIPYRTAYYSDQWGFCLPHEQFERLEDGTYEVCIDATLEPGHLTYGECLLSGELADEILISAHVCHPSLCNDNLSGVAVAAQLAGALRSVTHRYSYRFLFIPATIGSITWLSRNQHDSARVRHGLVLACVGDPGPLTYKKSRRGNAESDRAVAHVLAQSGQRFSIREFEPWGYDERQFCSPGFNLPVGLLSRTPHGEFPEYHTSDDDLRLVQPEALADTFATCLEVFDVLEGNRLLVSTNQQCEPQLGRRGLYRAVAGQQSTPEREHAMLWVLNLCDGLHSLLDIAERARLPFAAIRDAATVLERHGLLRSLDDRGVVRGRPAEHSAVV